MGILTKMGSPFLDQIPRFSESEQTGDLAATWVTILLLKGGYAFFGEPIYKNLDVAAYTVIDFMESLHRRGRSQLLTHQGTRPRACITASNGDTEN